MTYQGSVAATRRDGNSSSVATISQDANSIIHSGSNSFHDAGESSFTARPSVFQPLGTRKLKINDSSIASTGADCEDTLPQSSSGEPNRQIAEKPKNRHHIAPYTIVHYRDESSSSEDETYLQTILLEAESRLIKIRDSDSILRDQKIEKERRILSGEDARERRKRRPTECPSMFP